MSDLATKFGFRGGAGPVYGSAAPLHATGRFYPPHLSYTSAGATLTTTAGRLYYMPYLITEIRSYAGFVIRNTGAGDTGEKVRIGLYLDRTGGLVKAATELGWHWICAHFDSATAVKIIYGAGSVVTAAGFAPPNMSAAMFGVYSANGDDQSTGAPATWYVDTSYGALASTMVAPTATATSGPWVALKA